MEHLILGFVALFGLVAVLTIHDTDVLSRLFKLAGFVALAVIAYRLVSIHRSREAHLYIDSPALPGSTFTGRVMTGLSRMPSEFVLTLTCMHERATGSASGDAVNMVIDAVDGDGPDMVNSRTIRTKLFENSQVVKRKAISSSSSGVVVPFSFRIPMDARAGAFGREMFLWRLDAEADIPGIDFKATFEVSFG